MATEQAVIDALIDALEAIDGNPPYSGEFDFSPSGAHRKVFDGHLPGRATGKQPYLELVPQTPTAPVLDHTDGDETVSLRVGIYGWLDGVGKPARLRTLVEDLRRALWADLTLNDTCELVRLVSWSPVGAMRDTAGKCDLVIVTYELQFELGALTP